MLEITKAEALDFIEDYSDDIYVIDFGNEIEIYYIDVTGYKCDEWEMEPIETTITCDKKIEEFFKTRCYDYDDNTFYIGNDEDEDNFCIVIRDYASDNGEFWFEHCEDLERGNWYEKDRRVYDRVV